MTKPSTTIRVRADQRARLRDLAALRSSTMTDTLDQALEALRREDFYRSMADAEASLRADTEAWDHHVDQRDTWLNAPAS